MARRHVRIWLFGGPLRHQPGNAATPILPDRTAVQFDTGTAGDGLQETEPHLRPVANTG